MLRRFALTDVEEPEQDRAKRPDAEAPSIDRHTSKLPDRPDGQVYLRPQGAAIIKIVSQMIGEALGDPRQVELAHTAIKWRKFKEAALDKVPFYKRPRMSGEVLDKSVVPEHAEYMKALGLLRRGGRAG